MKIPLRWLQEFVELPTWDPDELSGVLAMLGHEVEGYEMLEPDWTEVYVGQVLEIAAHPDADKIRVCQVDSGNGAEQIICGAWNFDEGAFVAVARPGSVLPGDFEIGVREIRGITSSGMICSEKELALGQDHEGILVLDGEPEIGQPFANLLELPDAVFDLTITPNRPDAMSVHGIARDLAAHYHLEVRLPDIEEVTIEGTPAVSVSIEDPEGCRRFVAREVTGVTVRKSPMWMRHRLQKAGIRSISNVVDVTNYVMVELGHPLHAFDAESIAGDRLTIKRAVAGEHLATLDEVDRKLTPEDLIIYDDLGPTSMSGTMGGARSEVSASTERVLMEAASWDPPTIMYMSRRHGLRSEASTRFERGVDPLLADYADRRASHLVAQLSDGAVLSEHIDEMPNAIEPLELDLPLEYVKRILGPGFDSGHVTSILTGLGMKVTGGDPLHVVVPTFRPDIERPVDLIEEVARLHGFEKFGSTVPVGRHGGLSVEQRRLRKLHSILMGAGLNQAVTLTLVGEEAIAGFGWDTSDLVVVKNPLREEEGRLRNVMVPSLVNSLAYNLSHGIESAALFETGRVFSTTPSDFDPRLPYEEDRLCVALTGQFGLAGLSHKPFLSDADVVFALIRHLVDVLRVDDVVLRPGERAGLHPGRTADVLVGGETIGFAGELLPSVANSFGIKKRVAVFEVALAPLLAAPESALVRPPSTFPHSDFDLSFVVPADMPAASLLDATSRVGGELVEDVRVFDEFVGVGEGQKALAIRYRLRSSDSTLTGEQAAEVRAGMVAAGEAIGAMLRGAE